jgi:hypothetical protein
MIFSKKHLLLFGIIVCNTAFMFAHNGIFFIKNTYDSPCDVVNLIRNDIKNKHHAIVTQTDSARLPMDSFLNPTEKDALMPNINTVSEEDMAPIIAAFKTTLIQAAANAKVKDFKLSEVTLTKGNIEQSITDAFAGGNRELRGTISVSGCDDDFMTTITVYARDYGKSTFDKRIHYKKTIQSGDMTKTIEQQGMYKVPTAYTIVVCTYYKEVACFGSDTDTESSIEIRGKGILFTWFEIAQTGTVAKVSKPKKKQKG